MWSSSSFQRLLQRHPSGPTQAQRPPSRFHTARRTIAGIVDVASGDAAAVGSGRFVFRSGATAPLRLPERNFGGEQSRAFFHAPQLGRFVHLAMKRGTTTGRYLWR